MFIRKFLKKIFIVCISWGDTRPILKSKLKSFLFSHPKIFVYFKDIRDRYSTPVKTLQTNAKKLKRIEEVSNMDDFIFDANCQYQPTPPVIFPLPKGQRKIYYYVDHTILCSNNTGMQQVTRRLGRALLEAEEKICFVKWDAHLHQFILLNQDELTYLSQWYGPSLSPKALDLYPKSNDNPHSGRKARTGRRALVGCSGSYSHYLSSLSNDTRRACGS